MEITTKETMFYKIIKHFPYLIYRLPQETKLVKYYINGKYNDSFRICHFFNWLNEKAN